MQNKTKIDHKYHARKHLDIHKAFFTGSHKVFFNFTRLLHAHTKLKQILQDMDYSCRLLDHKSCDAPCSFKLHQEEKGVEIVEQAATAAGKWH